MRFSQKIGRTPIKTVLQIDSMDNDLRNSLWNRFRIFGLERITRVYRIEQYPAFLAFFQELWADFFKLPIDDIPQMGYDINVYLREWFFGSTTEWYEVYDFIEFVANTSYVEVRKQSRFRQRCNEIFERELSGYRFVGDCISPITNESEIEEIEEVLKTATEKGLEGVKEHIKAALAKLSDRKQPDYRNSIKESISGVESIAKVISGNPKTELPSALKIIRDKIGLHPALEKGFNSIYGYTSDGDGIRHALMDESTCDFEDAKYMLVSCSAFINYLIMKGQKAGIL